MLTDNKKIIVHVFCSNENLHIFTLLQKGAILTWVQQMRYQHISFSKG